MQKFFRLAVAGWLLPAAAFAQNGLTQTVRGTVTDQVAGEANRGNPSLTTT